MTPQATRPPESPVARVAASGPGCPVVEEMYLGGMLA
jgi:hypothetical protein